MLLCYFNIYKELYKNRVSPTRRVHHIGGVRVVRVLGKVTPLFSGYRGSRGVGEIMQVESVTIDQLIAAHWGTCDVQSGETPEDYASRHEASRPLLGMDLVCFGCEALSMQFVEGRVVILSIPPENFWRLKESS